MHPEIFDLKSFPYIISVNEVIEEVGYSFLDLTGYRKEDFLGKSIRELQDVLRINKHIYDLTSLSEQMKLFLVTRTLEIREVACSVHQGINFKEKLYIFIELKNSRIEDKIPLANQFCLDNFKATAIYSYPELILLKANESYLNTFPKPYNELNKVIGLRVKDFLPQWEDAIEYSMWEQAVNSEKTFLAREVEFVRAQGEKKWFDLIIVPIKDNGKCRYIINIINDITDKVEREKLLKEQQQTLLEVENKKVENLKSIIKMKDEFFSFISHEFKTPLTVINSAIQAMEILCRNELTEKSKQYLARIRQNTYRQLRLVNNLLDISRAEAGYLKVNKNNQDIVFVTRSIIDSISQYAIQKEVYLKFETNFTEKTIAIDEEKYERILLNLLSNAIKFTPKGKNICVRLSQRKKMIHIEIEDEGVGVPKDKQELIFDRFGQVNSNLTRNSEGTGIGLALVKLLVQSLDGDITLTSDEGAGSTFIVKLPNIKIRDQSIQEQMKMLATDNRLIQAVAIEFSDIYL